MRAFHLRYTGDLALVVNAGLYQPNAVLNLVPMFGCVSKIVCGVVLRDGMLFNDLASLFVAKCNCAITMSVKICCSFMVQLFQHKPTN